jgi:uncharacterized delta-60 repeat protein
MTSKAKNPFVVCLALLVLGAVVAVTAVAADRTDPTDPTFGSGGVAAVQPPEEAQGRVVGVRDLDSVPGGMVAAVGGLEGFGYFAAARLGGRGSLDTTFGQAGFTQRLRIRHPGSAGDALWTQAEGVDVQLDGRIVVAGYQENSLRGTAPLLARFRPDGSLDRSFGRGGVVAPKPASEGTDALHSTVGGGLLHDVAVQRGGRIVAVGAQNEERGARPAAMVIAYRPNGRIDRGFGRQGRLLLPARERAVSTTLTTVEVLRNRKILVAGYLRGRLVVLRLTPTGRLDRSFGGGDGKVTPRMRRFFFCCHPPALLEVQRDGRILLGSEAVRRGEYPFVLARFHPDGRPDRSFGKAGLATGRPPAGRGFYLVPTDVAVQGNRRIVVVGYRERVAADRKVFLVFTALRYLPNGRLDRSFSDGGMQTLSRTGGSSAWAAVTQPNGRVVAGGGAEEGRGLPPDPALLLTRYLPGGQ